MQHYREIANLDRPQSIITVANEEAQDQIKTYLTNMGHKAMIDYFFFC